MKLKKGDRFLKLIIDSLGMKLTLNSLDIKLKNRMFLTLISRNNNKVRQRRNAGTKFLQKILTSIDVKSAL